MQHHVYFDANATTPMFPRAREVFIEAMDRYWHNPSSLYREAGAVRRALDEAREQLATLLGLAEARRLIFTSGATEANNLVIRHFACCAPAAATLVTSPLEHPSLREPAASLFPGRVVQAPLAHDAWHRLIEESSPALVSIMAANNETGILLPWQEIASLCRNLGISFHCDAAQWIGKMPLDELDCCDWVTGSAHKFGGPKGAGFLVIPSHLSKLHGSLLGGAQESGFRAGTENAPAVLAMASALVEAQRLLPACSPEGRDAFEARLRETIPGARIVGTAHPRLWNTSLFCLPGPRNVKWLTRLSHLGFQAGAGSACSAGKDYPLHVLEAMEVSPSEMTRVIRASATWQSSTRDWLALADAVQEVWRDMQNPSSETREKRKIRL